jgi:hypothetical protein
MRPQALAMLMLDQGCEFPYCPIRETDAETLARHMSWHRRAAARTKVASDLSRHEFVAIIQSTGAAIVPGLVWGTRYGKRR